MLPGLACKPPPLTPHCSYATGYHKSTYGYGEKVAYKCHSNYVMLGNAYGVCMESGYWSTPAPKCYSKLIAYRAADITQLAY